MSALIVNDRYGITKGPGQLIRFLLNVLRDFKRNQGLLLCGAVAYYTLLSVVPLSILALIGMSHIVEEEQLFHTLSVYLEMIIPGYAVTLTEQVRVFLAHRDVVGVIGFLVMLFFSSVAFTVLENAMSVIFFHRVRIKHRSFLISTLIPYVYIFVLGCGILLVSFITGAIETVEKRHLILFGWTLSLDGISGVVLYALGIVGEVLLLTSLYLVMPVVRITFRRALIGGVAATILWEITRRVLVWY
jgi:membrane protein